MTGQRIAQSMASFAGRVRGKRWGIWGVIALGVVLSYLFLYPVVLIPIEDADGSGTLLDLPEWADEVVDMSELPLFWLIDNCDPYHDYVQWLVNRMEN